MGPAVRFTGWVGFTGGIEAVRWKGHDSRSGPDHDRDQVAPSISELGHRYKTASVASSHFHALWLLTGGYSIHLVAGLLSFSTRWIRILIERYNEAGRERVGDQRAHSGAEPRILTPKRITTTETDVRIRTKEASWDTNVDQSRQGCDAIGSRSKGRR